MRMSNVCLITAVATFVSVVSYAYAEEIIRIIEAKDRQGNSVLDGANELEVCTGSPVTVKVQRNPTLCRAKTVRLHIRYWTHEPFVDTIKRDFYGPGAERANRVKNPPTVWTSRSVKFVGNVAEFKVEEKPENNSAWYGITDTASERLAIRGCGIQYEFIAICDEGHRTKNWLVVARPNALVIGYRYPQFSEGEEPRVPEDTTEVRIGQMVPLPPEWTGGRNFLLQDTIKILTGTVYGDDLPANEHKCFDNYGPTINGEEQEDDPQTNYDPQHLRDAYAVFIIMGHTTAGGHGILAYTGDVGTPLEPKPLDPTKEVILTPFPQANEFKDETRPVYAFPQKFENLHLAIIATCFSGLGNRSIAEQLCKNGCDVAVGWEGIMDKLPALQFLKQFFENLTRGDGMTYEAAFRNAAEQQYLIADGPEGPYIIATPYWSADNDMPQNVRLFRAKKHDQPNKLVPARYGHAKN